MKITHVISDTNIGGAGILLSLLTSINTPECENEVILPRGSLLSSRLPMEKIKVTEFEMAKDMSLNIGDIPAFYRYFRESRPDIVHTHASLSARLAARLAGGIKCVSTRHCAYREDSSQKKNRLRSAIYNYCTDLTISTAEYATKNLISEGVEQSKIVTIKNGVAQTRRTGEEERAELKRRLGIPEGVPVIGSVARLEAVKGQDLIIRAHACLIKRMPVYLVFVGTGSYEKELRLLSARLGAAASTVFVGYTPDPAPYQNIFDVNVNASRGTETSCLATSECMSLGIPSCVSNFGGNPEQITDGENGVIFDTDNVFSLEEALLRILSDGNFYSRLSSGARARYLSDFSLKRMSDDYMGVYRKIKNIDNIR